MSALHVLLIILVVLLIFYLGFKEQFSPCCHTKHPPSFCNDEHMSQLQQIWTFGAKNLPYKNIIIRDVYA